MEFQLRNHRKRSTSVDLTPMVDLGFLLITFFMLATSFSKPKTMEVLKPEEGDQDPYPQSKTATLVLGTSDKIYTYSLPDLINAPIETLIDSTDYSPSGLRKYILRRQAEVKDQWGSEEMLFVIIKPLPGSLYKNIVDVLDEMLITNVKRYAIVQANSEVDSMIMNLDNRK